MTKIFFFYLLIIPVFFVAPLFANSEINFTLGYLKGFYGEDWDAHTGSYSRYQTLEDLSLNALTARLTGTSFLSSTTGISYGLDIAYFDHVSGTTQRILTYSVESFSHHSTITIQSIMVGLNAFSTDRDNNSNISGLFFSANVLISHREIGRRLRDVLDVNPPPKESMYIGLSPEIGFYKILKDGNRLDYFLHFRYEFTDFPINGIGLAIRYRKF